jgi:TolB-like protein
LKSRLFAAFAGVMAAVILMGAVPSAGIAAASKTVAVLPFAMNSPQDLTFLQNGLFSMLSSRLSDPGKVDVLDRAAVDTALAQASADLTGTLTQARARAIGERLNADYVLFGSLTHFGDSVSLDAAMVDITGEKPALTFFEQSNQMGDVIPLVNTFAGDINLKVFNRSIANELYAQPESGGPRAPGGFQAAGQGGAAQGGLVNLQQSGGKGFATHLKFEGVITAMATGDLNNDGTMQVVASTDDTLMIHRLSGNQLVLEKELEYSSINRIVSLDIADINGNGFPEIFVTSLNIQRQHVSSFVVEYNGNDYITLAKKEPYYFRVVTDHGGSNLLLGQKQDTSPFKGGIFFMTASGNGYGAGEKISMPRSVSVLSLDQGMIRSDDTTDSVLINEHGRLTLVGDAGQIVWKGNQKYGGTEHYFLLPQRSYDRSMQDRVYLHPRILCHAMDKEDRPMVIAVRNQELGGGIVGRYKRFTSGSVEFLAWNGIALAPVFKTASLQGWVSDFALVDIDNDGKKELLVSVVDKQKALLLTGSRSSSIISYELE